METDQLRARVENLEYLLEALTTGAIGRAMQNPSWLQPKWYIDPQNVTGNAKSNNSGLFPSQPVARWSDVIQRYGTESPELDADVDWTWLSDSPSDGSDPVTFTPTMNGSRGRMIGTPTLVGSGILAGVTPKNRAAGTLLNVDLAAVPSAASEMFLVNTTPGKESVCQIIRNTAGTFFDLSQPIIPSNGVLVSDFLEVDTYANGDTFQVFRQTKVDLVLLQPVVSKLSLGALNFFTLYRIGGLDTSPTFSSGPANMYLGDRIYATECLFNKKVILTRPTDGGNVLLINCAFQAHPLGFSSLSGGSNVAQASGTGSKPWLFGGWTNGMALAGAYIDGDAVVLTSARLLGGLIGAMYVDAGVSFNIGSTVTLSDQGIGAAIYGLGGINSVGRLSVVGATAAAALLATGGLRIDGQTTAFSATAMNPSVVNGVVPLTAVAIDAAAGPAGFGGNAFIPGGGAISTF
jgi:hypothetical protein